MTERVSNRSVEYVDGKGWLKTVPVHIPDVAGDGLIHVHKAGCGDLRKYPVPFPANHWDNVIYFEATSLKQVVEDVYRYGGSFYDEAGIPTDQREDAWRGYVGEFKVFPCVTLPDEPTYQERP